MLILEQSTFTTSTVFLQPGTHVLATGGDSTAKEMLEAFKAPDGTPITVMRLSDGYFNLTLLLRNAGRSS